MTLGEQIARVAERYVGTPYSHMGRVPGEALDCAGVAVCALQECGYVVKHDRYGTEPSIHQLRGWLRQHGRKVELEARQPGDILAMVYGRSMGHAAIVIAPDRMVASVVRKNGGGRVTVLPINDRTEAECWRIWGAD